VSVSVRQAIPVLLATFLAAAGHLVPPEVVLPEIEPVEQVPFIPRRRGRGADEDDGYRGRARQRVDRDEPLTTRRNDFEE
jgi:hypothetical protein